MSNQQPPYGQGGQPGQPPYGGQPGHGQPGPPQQGQPPYGGPQQPPPPGYGQPGRPPYQGQPPQGMPPQGPPPQGVPPQGRPPQQPPYQGQPPQPPYQQGPPPQQYPGQGQQPGYPPQQGFPGQQYPGQQQWSPQYGGGAPRGKGNNKILLLAGGGLAAVAVIGVVLALLFGGGDDDNVQPQPTTPTTQPTEQPTGQPTEQPTGEPTTEPSPEPSGEPTTSVDEGIEVAEGVSVKPQPGYLRKSLDGFSGVYLLKQGEAYFMVNAGKTSSTTSTMLPTLLNTEKKGLTQFKANSPRELKPGEGDKTDVKVVTTQSFQAISTSQNKSLPVVGFVGVIERNDGVVTIIRVFGRKDKAASIQTDSQAMLQSVIKSQ